MNLGNLFFLLWGMVLFGILGLLGLVAAALVIQRTLPPVIDREEPDFV